MQHSVQSSKRLPTDPYGVQVRLTQRRQDIELALLRTVYPVPPFVKWAVEEGIQPGHLWDDVHRHLFSACLVCHEHGRGVVYDLSIKALQHAGFWTEHKMATMGQWNAAKLADLAFGGMPWDWTPENARAAARRLLRFHEMQCSVRGAA